MNDKSENNTTVGITNRDRIAECIASGNKVPNGLYSTLSKAEKKEISAVRRERKSEVVAASARILGGELTEKGYVAEKCEFATLNGGVRKVTTVGYIRPSRGKTIASMSADEIVNGLSDSQRRDITAALLANLTAAAPAAAAAEAVA